MINKIEKVCVIGSGVMGCNIAAHFSNVGLNVYLFDQKVSENDADINVSIKNNLETYAKIKPSIFFDKDLKSKIHIGNLDDNLNILNTCDWIIEVVIENLKIKNLLFLKIDNAISDKNKNIIISSNTSGLPASKMCENTSLFFKQNFLITHFFNPVRYLHLLEIIPNKETTKLNVSFMHDFCERILGKGVIIAKESPNFIANRIGVYATLKAMDFMQTHNYNVSEVDYILGTETGKPKSAVFKTIDIVGIDTFTHVAKNCFDSIVEDEEHDIFRAPDFLAEMIKRKYLGRKTKQGFYKRDGLLTKMIDLKTFEYEEIKKPKYDSIEGARKKESISEKLRFIMSQNDKGSDLVSYMTISSFMYAANRVFEISDSIEDIDKAMRWGFNWSQGPFEICDIIGLKKVIELSKKYNCTIPEWLLNKDLQKNDLFYTYQDGIKQVWNPSLEKYCNTSDFQKGITTFSILKDNVQNTVKKLKVTNLIDLGDQVLACEFNTKLNSIDFDVLTDIEDSLNFCEENGYKGLVLYNEGVNFSVGMNLWLIYMGIQSKQWKNIDEMCKKYQDVCVRLKYSPTVTVSAPFNLTLGGGAELAMWCNSIEAHAELYMGLVEVAVGLIPGAGGNIEMMSRVLKNIPKDKKMSLDIVLSKSLENVAMAKVGTSALECRNMSFLSENDGITINKERHLSSAKLKAMTLINSGFLNCNRRVFNLPGIDAFANFKLMLNSMYEGGYITKHDLTVALKTAFLMSGGNCNPKHHVDEQTLLDLERETFLSLCGERKTIDRIEHMLKKKKPLRN